jgi:hypothetical protein
MRLGKILCKGLFFVVSLHREKITKCRTDKNITTMKMMMMNSKRLIFALVTMLTLSLSANAMSYEQARNEALFLTDKMAYELNLTDAQYEAAYEINLDYLMGVTSVDDVFGVYWERRNLDLSYILYSWQWDAFRAATYFYRPLFWEAGYWHFGIYARYPRRDYFYFGRPHFYATYRGGHAWHLHGTNGYYHSHASHFRPSLPAGRQHFGMRNSFDRGDFRGVRGSSSTRVTGRPDNRRNSFNNRGNGGFGNRSNNFGDRQNSGVNNRNNGINSNAHGNFGGSRNFGSSQSGSASSSTERPARSVGNNSGVSNRSNSVNSNANGNFGGTRNFGSSQSGSTSRSTERPSRSFGNSSSAPSRSIGGSSSSAPSRSIGSSSSSAPSRSFGNSHSSVGGSRSSHSSGGSSMGGRSSSQGHSGGHGHFGGNRR